jgi:HAD superfamily hydrolase (TIGR01509 family)
VASAAGPRLLQAIVFDFDGVIANSEPLHLQAFQQTLLDIGITLTANDYYARYLGYDDVGVFGAIGQDRGRPFSADQAAELVLRKGLKMQALLHRGSVLFPGAAAFIHASAAVVPVAIASGALRHEIEEILAIAGLIDRFPVIVAAGDTPEGKPSPAPYRLAFEQLQERYGGQLVPARCVAIEDSQWGLASARAAGLRCVGVTTSYDAGALAGADLVVRGLQDLTLAQLDDLAAEAI